MTQQQKNLDMIGLNGLGSPFGIETDFLFSTRLSSQWLNGLGSPFGIETAESILVASDSLRG